MSHRLATIVFLLAGAVPAAAQPAPPPPEPEGPANAPLAEPPPAAAVDDSTQARLDALEQRLQAVEDELAATKDDNSYLEEKLRALLPLSGKLGGYLDVGFFATTGNGAGTRSDLVGMYFPEYVGIVPESWVFMGDPLSTAVNSRGDVADTGESRAVVFDPIDSAASRRSWSTR